jgi:DHA3 family macrolide efflux protein-like MFS transporter
MDAAMCTSERMTPVDTRTRNLWTYSLANAVSRFGDQYQFYAVMTLTYAITRSPIITALQMAISGLPVVLLARWTGPLADRYDPRRITFIVALVQAVLTLGYLLAKGVHAIMFLNFLVASAGVFAIPARAALLPQMVGRENLMKANARLASVNGGVLLIAPALAGTLITITGPTWAFLFNSLSFLFPAVAMLFIKPMESEVHRSSPPASGSVWSIAWEFLRQRPDLLLLVVTYEIYTLGMWAVNAIFYPYAVEVLHGGAAALGWSVSAYYGAYLLTGIVMERWGNRLRNPRFLYVGYLVGTAIWAGYTLTKSIWVAVALSAFDGLIFTFATTQFDTRVQEEAPPSDRGRIYAVMQAADRAVTTTGVVSGGALATYGSILGGIGWSSGLTAAILVGVIAPRWNSKPAAIGEQSPTSGANIR